MLKRNFNAFLLIQLLLYIAQGLGYCLMITFLASLGYTATDRSIMFTVSALVGIVLQFYIGYLCDKHHTIKKYVYWTHVFYIVVAIALYFYTRKHFFVHLLLVTANVALMRITVGLIDGWTLEVDEECKNRYGTIRAMGSIGWSIGSYVGSYLTEWFGYGSLGIAYTVVTVLMLLICNGVKDVQKEADAPITMDNVRRLLTNRDYMLVVLILFSLFTITCCQDYTVIDKLSILGATERNVSFYWIVTAMVELPLFFYGNKLGEKIGMKRLLYLTAFFYGLKFVLFGMVQSVSLMTAAAALQMCTFPLLTIVSKQLVDAESPEEMKVSAQQIGLSLYSGISGLIAPMMAGLLEDNIGIDATLYCIAAVSLVSLALIFLYFKGKKRGGNVSA